MIRFFAIFLIGAVVLTISAPLAAAQPGAFILGGHYHLGRGEVLKEDVSFYFAQVTIEEGASVDGHVFLFSSTLDLAGDVTEDIHAVESDLTLREGARVNGDIDEKGFIHWTLLLPAAIRLP